MQIVGQVIERVQDGDPLGYLVWAIVALVVALAIALALGLVFGLKNDGVVLGTRPPVSAAPSEAPSATAAGALICSCKLCRVSRWRS